MGGRNRRLTMTGKQLDFDLSRKSDRAKAGPKLAARMMAILAVNRGWLKRKDLARHGLTDRQCRLGRAASHGRIIRGQQGFKLLRYATQEEVRKALSAITAQIKAEQKQYDQLVKRAHRTIHERNAA